MAALSCDLLITNILTPVWNLKQGDTVGVSVQAQNYFGWGPLSVLNTAALVVVIPEAPVIVNNPSLTSQT
jgi:hypothetical protein